MSTTPRRTSDGRDHDRCGADEQRVQEEQDAVGVARSPRARRRSPRRARCTTTITAIRHSRGLADRRGERREERRALEDDRDERDPVAGRPGREEHVRHQQEQQHDAEARDGLLLLDRGLRVAPARSRLRRCCSSDGNARRSAGRVRGRATRDRSRASFRSGSATTAAPDSDAASSAPAPASRSSRPEHQTHRSSSRFATEPVSRRQWWNDSPGSSGSDPCTRVRYVDHGLEVADAGSRRGPG